MRFYADEPLYGENPSPFSHFPRRKKNHYCGTRIMRVAREFNFLAYDSIQGGCFLQIATNDASFRCGGSLLCSQKEHESRMAFISARWACFPWLVSCSDMFNVLVSNVFAGRRTRSVVCVYVSVCVWCVQLVIISHL
jgi:hypothetical protein